MHSMTLVTRHTLIILVIRHYDGICCIHANIWSSTLQLLTLDSTPPPRKEADTSDQVEGNRAGQVQ